MKKARVLRGPRIRGRPRVKRICRGGLDGDGGGGGGEGRGEERRGGGLVRREGREGKVQVQEGVEAGGGEFTFPIASLRRQRAIVSLAVRNG